MKTINNKLKEHALILSLICPIIGITLGSFAFLIPSPRTDMDFSILCIGGAVIPTASLIGLFASRKLISTAITMPIRMFGVFILLLNIAVLALGIIYNLIVGLVGTTGNY